MVLLLALSVGWASADPIGPTCGTCQGSIYTLTYGGTPLADADPLHETYRVTLTINTSGYNGSGVGLDAVAVKVSSSVVSASLFAAPGGTSTWTLVSGGINAGGCSGSGGGFECADAVAIGGVPVPLGTPYSWTFDITMDNGALFTGANAASIKARYVDANAAKIGALVSEKITLQAQVVPEPTSLLLAGSALIGIGVWSRKRWLERRSA